MDLIAGDNFSGLLQEQHQDLSRLFLKLDPDTVFAQFPIAHVEFVRAETANRSALAMPARTEPDNSAARSVSAAHAAALRSAVDGADAVLKVQFPGREAEYEADALALRALERAVSRKPSR